MGFSYNVNVLNQKGSPAIYTDTFANRPAFGFAGRLFIANDTAAIYEDTGTAWVLIANVSSGAGTLQQVTTNGNTSNVGISVTAGGVSTNSATITSLTQGSVPFVGAAGLITQDNANLFFDDTNNRLGINTNTPSNNLDINGTGTTALLALNNTSSNQSLISFLKNSSAKWCIGNSSTDTFDVLNVGLTTNAISISNASNCVSFLANLLLKQSTGFQSVASFNGIACDAGGFFFQLGTSNNVAYLNFIGLTAARTFTFPDAAGTLALTSNLSAYLPLTGGTLTGSLAGTTATFSGLVGLGSATATNPLNIRTADGESYIRFISADGTTYGDFERSITAGGAIRFTGANFRYEGKLYIAGNTLMGSVVDDTVNKLQVTGSSVFTGLVNFNGYGNQIKIGSNGGTDGFIGIGSAQSTMFIGDYSSGTIGITITLTSGNVKISSLAGTGSRAVLADAAGTLSAPVSDISVKENIEPLKYGLETIMKLNAVQFEFIEGYKNYGEGLQIGAIAQEVEQIIPEAVFKTPSTGLKGIDYNQFNGIYIKAIQDQQKIIESLIQRIELLENK